MPKPSDPITLPPVILRALDLDPDNSIRGNVAAHAYNLAFGSGSNPFAGINLGWADQSDSTDFLVALVEAVETALDDGEDMDEWDTHEAADGAVPIYNREAVMVALELGAEVDDAGLLPEEPTLGSFAQIALYCTATQILGALARAIVEDDGDEDDESFEEDDRGVVEVLDADDYAEGHPDADVMTCGACGRSWDDAVSTSWTPAPASRCPFEADHETEA